MFLTNLSPSVALQRKLEPSSHPRGSWYPISSSEPLGDLARVTVSTEVQRITRNLPSEEALLGRSHAHGHLLQEGSKARGRKPREGLQTLQGRMADSNGMEVEEDSKYDSDNSVDREIEEAIQEYLRGNGLDGQSLADREANEKLIQEERSAHDPTCSTFHADVGAAGIQQERASEDRKSEGVKWPLSHSSLSSTNYFGQSAPAETEEFLSERKEQARKRRRRARRVTGRDNPLDGKEA
ncbi:hypothetical protein JRQ81_002100 [Phrynocephalus forsythii]|uniref:Protein phosphatase 1 regulatory subunit 26 N-terminal domain-containing protein n=1 Tax=Phrynocephalus forsythii TaxID=171643 RepID=A0A9Q0XJG3_9SAUR|nr:hypothetical protein JRQ81_002100 [Phrynocephalus forsythii]